MSETALLPSDSMSKAIECLMNDPDMTGFACDNLSLTASLPPCLPHPLSPVSPLSAEDRPLSPLPSTCSPLPTTCSSPLSILQPISNMIAPPPYFPPSCPQTSSQQSLYPNNQPPVFWVYPNMCSYGSSSNSLGSSSVLSSGLTSSMADFGLDTSPPMNVPSFGSNMNLIDLPLEPDPTMAYVVHPPMVDSGAPIMANHIPICARPVFRPTIFMKRRNPRPSCYTCFNARTRCVRGEDGVLPCERCERLAKPCMERPHKKRGRPKMDRNPDDDTDEEPSSSKPRFGETDEENEENHPTQIQSNAICAPAGCLSELPGMASKYFDTL
eukprot:246529_1